MTGSENFIETLAREKYIQNVSPSAAAREMAFRRAAPEAAQEAAMRILRYQQELERRQMACNRMGIMDPDGGISIPDELL